MKRVSTFSTTFLFSLVALLAPIGGCSSPSTAPDFSMDFNGLAASDVPGEQTLSNEPLPYTQWPLQLDTAQGLIEIYQPQPQRFEGDELTARAAISWTKPGTKEPVFGAVWFTARVRTDREIRSATITEINIRHVVFPDTTAGQEQQFAQTIRQQVSGRDVTFSLDELMTSLDVVEQQREQSLRLKNDPPTIVFSQVPATLVTLDGAPKLQPVAGSEIMRVVNTPLILLQDPRTKRYYLKTGQTWMSAADISGPWAVDSAVPAAIASAGASLATPPAGTASAPAGASPSSAPPGAPGTPARIIVAQGPIELVVTTGLPAFAPLVGNDLSYATNTQSELFKENSTGELYLLLSGRWFKAPAEAGPWTYVASDKLPASFAKIPPDSPKGAVLSFVAGTTQAQEAKLDARVPQTSVIRRDAGADLHVIYDGPAKFETIAGVAGQPISYAVNSGFDVFQVGDGYYCCFQGVWYDAASPTGPWNVCVEVPPEIYQIPPTCPLYHDTYCRVYDYFPDEVYVGYTPGYLGTYVDGPTIVYGTGYAYAGWFGDYYIPGPCTWGFGVAYDPWTCDWGFGACYDCGFGWFGFGRFHHRWWGPGGFVDWHHMHDWHEGHQWHAGETHGPHEAVVRPSNEHAGSFHNLYTRHENAHRNAPALGPVALHARATPNAGAARSFPQRQNNVYAGHNGQVYRYSGNGWEERSGSNWSRMNSVPQYRPPVYRTPANRGGMEAERGSRERGAVRSHSFGGHYSGGGGYSGGGHSGGGGGGGHSGGGHRGVGGRP